MSVIIILMKLPNCFNIFKCVLYIDYMSYQLTLCFFFLSFAFHFLKD